MPLSVKSVVGQLRRFPASPLHRYPSLPVTSDSMPLTIAELHGQEIEAVIPLLTLAEPEEDALRWGLAHLSDAVYAGYDAAGALVAAVSVRWRGDPVSIEELAVDPARHGEGIGRAVVGRVFDEARRRGKRAVVVGTTNAAIGNIAFYQKCGFRLHAVKRDYFAYYETYYGGVRVENGIPVRDMLVLRCDIPASSE